MKTTSRQTDYVLLAYFVVLALFGLLVLSSAAVAVGAERFGDPYFFIKRQLLLGFLPGLILFFIVVKINYHIWKKYAWPIFILGFILLLLPFIPGIGAAYNTGARSWVTIAGQSFQPSEAVKLALIIFMAAWLSSLGRGLEDFSHGFLPALGLGLVPVALVALQPDIGTTLILFVILIFMLFFAQARWSHLLLLFLVAAIAFTAMIMAAPYRAQRLTTFLHPELDPQGEGYHINQAFLAIGSGGWLGLGVGHSQQKFQYLPEVQADSIFAVAAEELGFVIMLAFLSLLLFICWRGLYIAKHSRDTFGRLLAAGIIAWFILQSILNIGAMVGLLPLTGVPLPFVSHGGTALMVGMAAVGMLINVSKYAKQ